MAKFVTKRIIFKCIKNKGKKMGITIHYGGKLNSINQLEDFRYEIKDIAKDMGWQYNLLDNDINEPNTSRFENGTIVGHIPLRGIALEIHEDVEPLSFYFDKDGTIQNILSVVFRDDDQLNVSSDFVKTQFAPVAVHITIIKLLRYIKSKYIFNLNVTDEGEYWETNDSIKLQEKFNFLSDKINEIGDLLDNTEVKETDTLETMADRIESILKKYFK